MIKKSGFEITRDKYELEDLLAISEKISSSFEEDYLFKEVVINCENEKKRIAKKLQHAGAVILIVASISNLNANSSYEFKRFNVSDPVMFAHSYSARIEDIQCKYPADFLSSSPDNLGKDDYIKSILLFKSLKESWDGYGAVPLEVESASNAIKMLNMLPSYTLSKLLDLYPNPNGTVSLDFENENNEKVAIEIGNNSFSYYVQYNSQEPLLYENISITNETIEVVAKQIKGL